VTVTGERMDARLAARRRLRSAERDAVQQEHERLLLKACLTQDARAIDAWRAWRASARRVDDLPNEQHRLVPLLHANLKALGVTDPEVKRYAGVRRFYWIRQHAVQRGFGPVLRACVDADVRLMLLKGVALRDLYEGSELRPTNDLDVWVHPSDFPRALEIVRDHGFEPVHHRLTSDAALRRSCTVEHAVGLRRDEDGLEVDLHARLHKAIPSTELPLYAWQRGGTTRYAGCTVRIPPMPVNLLHVAAHAHAAGGALATRAVADVAMAIRRGVLVEHLQDVIELATDARAITPLQRVVRHAYEALGADVEEVVETAFASVETSRSERFWWNVMLAPGGFKQARDVLFGYGRFREVAMKEGRGRVGVLAYLRDMVHARSRTATVALLVRLPFRRAALTWRKRRGEAASPVHGSSRG